MLITEKDLKDALHILVGIRERLYDGDDDVFVTSRSLLSICSHLSQLTSNTLDPRHYEVEPIIPIMMGISKVFFEINQISMVISDKIQTFTVPSDEDEEESCYICKFYKSGRCRKRAPSAIKNLNDETGRYLDGAFPSMYPSDWCGDYLRRVEGKR